MSEHVRVEHGVADTTAPQVVTVSPSVSHKIKIMSLVSAVMVIFIHVPQIAGSDLTAGIEHFISQGICRVAVPFFFTVSGYMLARHMNEEDWWWGALRKRSKSIVAPYFLWCLISSLVRVAISVMLVLSANIMHHESLSRNMMSVLISPLGAFGLNPFGGVVSNGALWYLRELMIFVLVSPLIVWIVKRGKIISFAVLILFWGLGVVFGVLFPIGNVYYHLFDRWISFGGLFYFMTGMYLSRYPVKVGARCGQICLVAGLLIMLFLSVRFACGTDVRGGKTVMLNIAIPLTLIGLWHYVPSWDVGVLLAGLQFPIYVIHSIVLFAVLAVVRPFSSTFPCTLLGYFACAVFALMVSVALAIVIRKHNGISTLLFGGR